MTKDDQYNVAGAVLCPRTTDATRRTGHSHGIKHTDTCTKIHREFV